MSSQHSSLLADILTDATARGMRLSRNETGVGFLGDPVDERDESTSRGRVHVVTLLNARRVRYGVFGPVQGVKDSGGGLDLIGWTPLIITERHVGSLAAIFTAIDAKTGGQRLAPNQRNFAQVVTAAGGLCYVGRRGEGDIVTLDLVGLEPRRR
jgi:hypothetical protein